MAPVPLHPSAVLIREEKKKKSVGLVIFLSFFLSRARSSMRNPMRLAAGGVHILGATRGWP